MSENQESSSFGFMVHQLKERSKYAQEVISSGSAKRSRTDELEPENKDDMLIKLQYQEILRLQEHNQHLSKRLAESKEEKQRLYDMFERERDECIETNTKLTENEVDLEEAESTLKGALAEIARKKNQMKSLKTRMNKLTRENKIKSDFLQSVFKQIQMMEYAQKFFIAFIDNQRSQIEMLQEGQSQVDTKVENTDEICKLKDKIGVLEAEIEIWRAMKSAQGQTTVSRDTRRRQGQDSDLPYKCSVCKKTFDELGPLKHHMRVDHSMPGILDSFIYGCKSCGDMFETEEQFKKHNCDKNVVEYLSFAIGSFVDEACGTYVIPEKFQKSD